MVNGITKSVSFVSNDFKLDSNISDKTVINFQTETHLKQEEQIHLPAEKAIKMTESINRFMETTNTNLRFQYHEDLKEYYVTIVDSKTNELVKEIPSKKLMDIYAAMRDFLGLMVDHKI